MLTLNSNAIPVVFHDCDETFPHGNPSCEKQKLEDLKETLRNSSRMHVEENGSISQQIDEIMTSLGELEDKRERDCASVTWTNALLYRLFGKKHLCI